MGHRRSRAGGVGVVSLVHLTSMAWEQLDPARSGAWGRERRCGRGERMRVRGGVGGGEDGGRGSEVAGGEEPGCGRRRVGGDCYR